eukprot:scaffold2830_cov131-Cylindrotheca_fusiformis.AAC.95
MVRRIKACSICDSRFISVANDPTCSLCKQQCALSSPPPPPPRLAFDFNNTHDDDDDEDDCDKLESNCKRQKVEIIDLSSHSLNGSEDKEDEDDKGNGSEGEDEIHCTQMDLEFDDEDDDEPKNIPLETTKPCDLPPTFPPQTNPEDAPSVKPSDNDICFICGVDLTTLKRRVDHIKRCSKKHGITGRDVKINNDHEEFVAPTTTDPVSVANPYNKENDWHGDSVQALRLGATAQHDDATTITTTTKQTSLSSFFKAPIQNVNNVLLAGARRVSKAAELTTKRKPSNKQQNPPGSRNKPVQKRRFGNGNYSKKTCPMYKRIPGTDFVCDAFHYAKCANTQNHFLTHFHADHYGGITSSWNHGTIYCSLPTANLVSQQLGVDKKYIHPLPMLLPTVIESKGKPVTVTLLDANHCPGAIMFLFEVGKKTILHVGDFRWNREIMMQQAPLRALQKNTTLDELFLDTTYCDSKYNLPSQAEAIQATIRIFEEELKNKAKTLHLFGAYTIGKEKMYLSVATKFGMKVYVDSRRYRILSALEWPKERINLLTQRKEEASIWVVPLGDINFKRMPDYLPEANRKPFSLPYKRVVGYRPTGWSMGTKPSASTVTTRRSGGVVVHSVPYSEHSSFPELLDCLECLKPQRIVPTVSVSKSDEQVKLLLTSLREKQTTLKFAKS